MYLWVMNCAMAQKVVHCIDGEELSLGKVRRGESLTLSRGGGMVNA